MKPWVIQSYFPTFNSIDRTSVTIHWKAVEQFLLWCCFFFNFTQLVILENLSILGLAWSGVKRLNPCMQRNTNEEPDLALKKTTKYELSTKGNRVINQPLSKDSQTDVFHSLHSFGWTHICTVFVTIMNLCLDI